MITIMLAAVLATQATMPATVPAVASGETYEGDPEAQNILRRVDVLAAAQDLPNLKEFAGNFIGSGSSRKLSYFGPVVQRIVGSLTTVDFSDNSQLELARKYIKTALSSPDGLSMKVQMV